MDEARVDFRADLENDGIDLLSLAGIGGGEANRQFVGVRALMLAVLEDAIRCYLEGKDSDEVEARLWIRSQERSSPFAFEVVCETLGLNPAAVRDALRRMKSASENRPKFARRLRGNARVPSKVCIRTRRRSSRERRLERLDAEKALGA